MSEDLLSRLRFLEEDYRHQPPTVRQADLQEINQIRSQLGMPLVDARLNEIGAAKKEVPQEPAPKQEALPDYTEARKAYQAYLQKIKELEPHQAYASRVARATGGPGMTPVEPLATMGNNGGPLLCDHCRKPIVLEGGNYHGVNADVAWRQNPGEGWNSWILGGMVVEIQTNGTLRIYHGYPGRSATDCCNVATREDDKAREEHKDRPRPPRPENLLEFLEHELPDLTSEEHQDLFSNILDTLYSYDPGIGINRPTGEC